MAAIGIAVISVLSLVYANLYSSVRQVQSKVDLLNTVAAIQLNLTNTANDARSWTATLNDTEHNASMACLRSQTCTTARSGALVLWSAETSNYKDLSKATYDGTNSAAGFTLSGRRCSEFTPDGNRACPLHVDLTWSTPGCSPAPCTPPVTITASIQYRPGRSFSPTLSLNEKQLKLSFVQKANASNIPCSGTVAEDEAILCTNPPVASYRLICTSTGFRCGQVYY